MTLQDFWIGHIPSFNGSIGFRCSSTCSNKALGFGTTLRPTHSFFATVSSSPIGRSDKIGVELNRLPSRLINQCVWEVVWIFASNFTIGNVGWNRQRSMSFRTGNRFRNGNGACIGFRSSQICTRMTKGELPFRKSDSLNGLQAGDCDGKCS